MAGRTKAVGRTLRSPWKKITSEYFQQFSFSFRICPINLAKMEPPLSPARTSTTSPRLIRRQETSRRETCPLLTSLNPPGILRPRPTPRPTTLLHSSNHNYIPPHMQCRPDLDICLVLYFYHVASQIENTNAEVKLAQLLPWTSASDMQQCFKLCVWFAG